MIQTILLITYYAPSRGHAGGLRLLDLYAQIKKIHPKIHLTLIACKHSDADWGLEKINDIFDEVHWVSFDFFNSADINVQLLPRNYDVIDLQYHQSGALLKRVRKAFPDTKIVFSPMESQIRSFQLAAKNFFKNLSVKSTIGLFITALQEMYYCSQVEHISCVSLADLNVLKLFIPKKKLYLIETGVSLTEFSTEVCSNTFSDSEMANHDKKKLVFLAYFGSKTNREALYWFCKYVHPLIMTQVKDYQLMVVGRGLDEVLIHECDSESINWIGEIDDLSTTLLSATAAIAPALSGAGVRGKIHQYAAMSIPCVASPLSTKSLKYQHGQHIFLADSPADFARYCITLLADKKVAKAIGKNAHELCLSEYSWTSISKHIEKLYFI